MLDLFTKPWGEVPVVVLDAETTGLRPGIVRAVQIGLARFEGQRCVAYAEHFVDPGIPIPVEATAIHGITDEMVAGAPSAEFLFAMSETKVFLNGAQPAAYNASYDKLFIPAFIDIQWPWLDTLPLVRFVDQYVKGKGRHRLSVACERHGIALHKAHSAGHDAKAAGELFYKIANELPKLKGMTLGELLLRQRRAEAEEWFRFNSWLAQQPPLETESA